MAILSFSLCSLLLLLPIVSTTSLDDFLAKFQQNDYVLEFERVELARYNKDYYKNFTITTFKHNRTCPAVNATWIQETYIGNDVEIVTQTYRFASNEYRLFPMRFQFNYCKVLKDNTMGIGKLMNCGNFTGCPLKQGNVQICNWTPDTTRFPPLIPDGRYMMEMQAMNHSTELFVLHGYAIVSRPIV